MIDQSARSSMLQAYEKEAGLYHDLASTTASLLAQMLRDSGVQLHSVTHRSKALDSLKGKLSKPDKNYTEFTQVTDLAAVRITTYFAEDVDRIADVIESEFLIDEPNSIDKRQALAPDRFGYQSLHYVASITPERCRLVEYARYQNRKVEIQVRSILQHAWAEIEHDLGYKSAQGVPERIRRRFARIAGLLELADDEFAAIRGELQAYASTVPREIETKPESVGIDQISIGAVYNNSDSAISKLSDGVAAAVNAAIIDELPYGVDRLVTICNAVGLDSIGELEKAAITRHDTVVIFATRWLNPRDDSWLYRDIGLFFLAYVLVAERGDVDEVERYLHMTNIGASDDRQAIADKIVLTYLATVDES